MKSLSNTYKPNYIFIVAAILAVLSLSSLTFSGTKESTVKANVIKSMVMGINSTNTGLAQSSIYLAGNNKFEETVDPLINVLNDSSRETAIRVLAAYSLTMINNEKGIEAIKTASINNENYIVQGTCKFIYNNYLNINAEAFLSK
jgi:hypothetical protein